MQNLSIISVLAATIVIQSCNSGQQPTTNNSNELSGTISLSGAFALYPLAVKWGEEFSKLQPKVRFDTQGGGAGKGMTDALSGTVDIGMVSRDINEEEFAKGAFGFAVAKDAVIPTINTTNPVLTDLLAKGATKEKLIDIWITGNIKTWGQVAGNSSQESVNVYTRSDAAGAPETWAKFLGKKQEDLLGTAVFGDPGLAEAVTKDNLGIGFNNVNYVYDLTSKKPHPGLSVLPLDVNGNGTLDAEENFYGSLDELNNAIISGAYPSPPARPLYFVTKGKPTNPLVIEFLKWVLTEGQKHVAESGYVKLTDEIIQAEHKKLEQTN